MMLAMYSGLLPLILFIVAWPLYVATAPLTIGLVIYGWRKPGSLVTGRRRWVGIIAIVFALMQVAVLGFIVFWWFAKPRSHV
jgi:hypothetical protein